VRFVGERLAGAAVLLAAASLLTFAALEAAPGDFLTEARSNPRLSEETLARLTARYELDRSMGERYASWIAGVFRGDWGHSLAYDVPVAEVLSGRLKATLGLAMGALGAAWLAGVGLAVAAAGTGRGAKAGRWMAMVFLSVPEVVLVLGVAAMVARAGRDISEGWVAYLALVLATMPGIFVQALDGVQRAAEEGYVETARMNGLRGWRLWGWYVLPGAAAPLAANFGMVLGSALSASLLVECVLGYAGMGPLLLEAILARDTHLVTGAVLASTVVWTAGSAVADVAQAAVDPRLRRRAA
jgi:peptide/nickel transport system permease protein